MTPGFPALQQPPRCASAVPVPVVGRRRVSGDSAVCKWLTSGFPSAVASEQGGEVLGSRAGRVWGCHGAGGTLSAWRGWVPRVLGMLEDGLSPGAGSPAGPLGTDKSLFPKPNKPSGAQVTLLVGGGVPSLGLGAGDQCLGWGWGHVPLLPHVSHLSCVPPQLPQHLPGTQGGCKEVAPQHHSLPCTPSPGGGGGVFHLCEPTGSGPWAPRKIGQEQSWCFLYPRFPITKIWSCCFPLGGGKRARQNSFCSGGVLIHGS